MNHIHALRRCCFDMSGKSKSPSIMRKRVLNANSTFMKSSEWVPSRKIPEKTKEMKMALITIRRCRRSALACASVVVTSASRGWARKAYPPAQSWTKPLIRKRLTPKGAAVISAASVLAPAFQVDVNLSKLWYS